MAKREVKIGLMPYVSPEGYYLQGLYGQTVDVHEDDLKRFDEQNRQVVDESFFPTPGPEAVSVETEDAPEPEAPKRSGRRSTKQADDGGKPAATASKEKWIEYAVSNGVMKGDIEGMTRDDIAEMFSE